jgi:hypothetical protein
MSGKKEKVFFVYTCTVKCCADCPHWSRYNQMDFDNDNHGCCTDTGVEWREVKNPDILPRWCPMRGC